MLQLSICIPTYNRLADLQTGLQLLIPQVAAVPPGTVEIVIVDNASTDGTAAWIDVLASQYPFIRVFHNPINLGFDGNTAKCIEYAQGIYTALLSDDDFYLEGQVEQILRVIAQGEYCLIRLNYHTFLEDMHRPYQTFQPERDVYFARAADMYDIRHFHNGGHFSGVIFRSALAKEALTQLLAVAPLTLAERARGVYVELELRLAKSATLPAYFIGKRLLATSIPQTFSYAALENICLDHLRFYDRMLKLGLISPEEFAVNKTLTLHRLPQMIVTFTPAMSRDEIVAVRAGLAQYIGREWHFRLISVPLLAIGQTGLGKALYSGARRLARAMKRSVVYRSGILVKH